MAPARTSARRAQRAQNSRKQEQQQPQDVLPQPQLPPPPQVQQHALQPQSPPDDQHGEVQKLFLDPMSGLPLSLYVEKDVEDRDTLIETIIVSVFPHHCGRVHDVKSRRRRTGVNTVIQRYGGIVSPGYSGVMYILGTWVQSVIIRVAY